VPAGTVADLITQETVVGEEIDGPADFFKGFGQQFVPLSARELLFEGALEDRGELPFVGAQALGVRANRSTEFRRKVDAGARLIEDAGGDYETAWRTAIAAGDAEAEDGVRIAWRRDFEQRGKDNGYVVVPGSQDPPRAPRVDLQGWEDQWPTYGGYIADQLRQWGVQRRDTLAEMRGEFVERWLDRYMRDFSVGRSQARRDLSTMFDGFDVVKSYDKARQAYRLNYWRARPDLLNEAQLLGLETLNDDEREILSEWERTREGP
jgi:hypothetical protein